MKNKMVEIYALFDALEDNKMIDSFISMCDKNNRNLHCYIDSVEKKISSINLKCSIDYMFDWQSEGCSLSRIEDYIIYRNYNNYRIKRLIAK